MNWDYLMDVIDSESTPIDTLLRVHLFRRKKNEGEGSSKPRIYTISQKLLSNIIQLKIDSSVVSTYGIRVGRGNRNYFKSMLRTCDIYSRSIEDKTRDERFPLLRKFIQHSLEFLPKFPAKELSKERSVEIELLLKEDEDDPNDKNSRWLTQEEVDKQFPIDRTFLNDDEDIQEEG